MALLIAILLFFSSIDIVLRFKMQLWLQSYKKFRKQIPFPLKNFDLYG